MSTTRRRQKYQEWERDLQEWRSPAEFAAKLESFWAEAGDYLLTAAGTSFYQDAYCAQAFAQLRGAEGVRLSSDARPDFEIKLGGVTQAIEVTEADRPGRKRTLEIQDARDAIDAPTFQHALDEEWMSPAVAADILRTAAEGKNDDCYKPEWGLLILLNPPSYSADKQAIEACLQEATAVVRHRFAEVWVLWKCAIYNTWIGGQRGTTVLRP